MFMKIIIYASEYGSTKQYAMELSEKTGIMAVDYQKLDDINSYNTIIYLGGLYAGGILGMKKTFSKISDVSAKRIIIATVGLADVSDKNNTTTIRKNIKGQLSDDVYNQAHIYFLRGAIDYSRLGLKHKTMMALLYRKAKRLNENQKTAEIKAMIETYGKKVSFIDFSSLNPIIDEIK